MSDCSGTDSWCMVFKDSAERIASLQHWLPNHNVSGGRRLLEELGLDYKHVSSCDNAKGPATFIRRNFAPKKFYTSVFKRTLQKDEVATIQIHVPNACAMNSCCASQLACNTKYTLVLSRGCWILRRLSLQGLLPHETRVQVLARPQGRHAL